MKFKVEILLKIVAWQKNRHTKFRQPRVVRIRSRVLIAVRAQRLPECTQATGGAILRCTTRTQVNTRSDPSAIDR